MACESGWPLLTSRVLSEEPLHVPLLSLAPGELGWSSVLASDSAEGPDCSCSVAVEGRSRRGPAGGGTICRRVGGGVRRRSRQEGNRGMEGTGDWA